MKETKLISILKSFSLQELKDFKKFIESPYHNQGRNFIPFYKFLRKHYPDFPKEKLSGKILYRQLYPHKKYNEQTSEALLRVLYSKMAQLAEEFLAEEGLRKNKIYRRVSLLHELNKRGMLELLDKNSAKIEKNLEQELHDENYYFSKFLIKNEISIAFDEKNIKDVKKRAKIMDEALESLIVYLVHRLIGYRRLRDIVFDKNIPPSEFLQRFLNKLDPMETVNYFRTYNSINNSVSDVLYYSYKLAEDHKDVQSFYSLKKIYFKIRNRLNFEERISILMKLMNFCNYHETNEKQRFRNEYSELNELWIEESLKEKNYYPFQVRGFRNIIKIYVKSGQFEKAEDYLKKYSKYIDKDIRNDCLNYAKSRIEFESGDYQKALEYSGKCNFTIPMMIRDIKFIKIQSFLILKHFDAFKSEIDTFRHFLTSTSGIPSDVIKYDKMVLKYFVKFARVSEKKDKNEKELFYKELMKLNTNNDHLLWLISKIR